MDNEIIWSCHITDHELMPAPRLPHDRRAQLLDQRAQRYFSNRDTLAWIIRSVWRRKQIEGPCILRAEVGITHNRKCDWDNFGKTIGDALVVAGPIKDDKQIERGEITVFRSQKHPFVTIALYEGGVKPCLVDSRTIKTSVLQTGGTRTATPTSR